MIVTPHGAHSPVTFLVIAVAVCCPALWGTARRHRAPMRQSGLTTLTLLGTLTLSSTMASRNTDTDAKTGNEIGNETAEETASGASSESATEPETFSLVELCDTARSELEAAGVRPRDPRANVSPDPRTLRWYQTLKILDPPLSHRDRKARYGPRHLDQILALKRLQAAGATLEQASVVLHSLDQDGLHRAARTTPNRVPNVARFWSTQVSTAPNTQTTTDSPFPAPGMTAHPNATFGLVETSHRTPPTSLGSSSVAPSLSSDACPVRIDAPAPDIADSGSYSGSYSGPHVSPVRSVKLAPGVYLTIDSPVFCSDTDLADAASPLVALITVQPPTHQPPTHQPPTHQPPTHQIPPLQEPHRADPLT